MPFEIVRNDITAMKADAIVNTANHFPLIGAGVDSAIHKKAGGKLLEARKKIGEIPFGDAAITPAFELQAKFVIHTVSPIWRGGGHGEVALLESCYLKSLSLALENGCESIAFPLLSAGNLGFPRDVALKCAVNVISDFLMRHEMRVFLVVFDSSSFKLSGKLFNSVKSFVDESYVDAKKSEEYGGHETEIRDIILRWDGMGSPAKPRLEDMVGNVGETFSEALVRIIDEKGFRDPDVYKRANIDRRFFSKIRSNRNYRPGKSVCVAFAIALELSLDETREFIGKAGYTLTHSDKSDIIIEFFIRNRNYDICEINETLFEFGQPILCG